jgi:hypothetical protein
MTTATLTIPSAAERAATAAELRDKARNSNSQAQKSWERSDTDGFLSQWASTSMADKYNTEAALAERGGLTIWQVPAQAALYLPKAKFGAVWMLLDDDDQKVGFAKPYTNKIDWVFAVVPATVEGFGNLTIRWAEVPVTKRSDAYPTFPTEEAAEAALDALLAV